MFGSVMCSRPGNSEPNSHDTRDHLSSSRFNHFTAANDTCKDTLKTYIYHTTNPADSTGSPPWPPDTLQDR